MAKKKSKKKEDKKKDSKKKKLLKLKLKKKKDAKKKVAKKKDAKKKVAKKPAPVAAVAPKAPQPKNEDHSSNYNVKESVAKLRSFKTREEILAFTKGEKRITVTRVIPAALNRLKS